MKKKSLLLILLLIPLLTALLLFGLVQIKFYFSLKDDWTPEVAKQYTSWTQDPITLPADALNAEPFQKETVAAAEAFRHAYDSLGGDVESVIDFNKGKPPKEWRYLYTDNPPELPLAQMDKLTTVTAAFENLVNRPDYLSESEVAGLGSVRQ